MTFGTPQRGTGNAGIYLGKVTALDGTTAYVEVPRLAPGFEYPARFPAELAATDTLEAGAHDHPGATIGTTGDHDHPATSTAAGDHAHAAAGTHDHGNGDHTNGGLVTAGTQWNTTTGNAHTHNITGRTTATPNHDHPATGDHDHPIDVTPAGGHDHPLTEGTPAPAHVHRLRPLEVGDPVAVAFLEGGRDELVVLVRLA